MGGLGKFARELHMNVVPQIKDSGVASLVGEIMKQLKDEFDKDVKVLCFDDAELLGAEIDK